MLSVEACMKKYLLLIVLLAGAAVVIPFMHLNMLNTILSEVICIGCIAIAASSVASSKKKDDE